ncbi:MAG: hypothetical protein QW587_05595 [Candidatus Bathyarchaeia archaeon]
MNTTRTLRFDVSILSSEPSADARPPTWYSDGKPEYTQLDRWALSEHLNNTVEARYTRREADLSAWA